MIDGLEFDSHKAHEGDAHQARDNKRNAQATQGCRDMAIFQPFADGRDGHNGQQPTNPRAKSKHGGLANVLVSALLHK